MAFDPYSHWLDIPTDRRPPTHFDLLGVPPDETDEQRIRRAQAERYARIRTYALGTNKEHADRLLDELAQALVCLTDPGRREAYRRQMAREGRLPGHSPLDTTLEETGDRTVELVPSRAVTPSEVPEDWAVAEPEEDVAEAIPVDAEPEPIAAEVVPEEGWPLGEPRPSSWPPDEAEPLELPSLRELGHLAMAPIRGIDGLLRTVAGAENEIVHNFLRIVAVAVILLPVGWAIWLCWGGDERPVGGESTPAADSPSWVDTLPVSESPPAEIEVLPPLSPRPDGVMPGEPSPPEPIPAAPSPAPAAPQMPPDDDPFSPTLPGIDSGPSGPDPFGSDPFAEPGPAPDPPGTDPFGR